MSLMIENIDDLRRLLKQTGVKINTVEDLNSLFRSINAAYDPDSARVRAIKLTCLTVPSVTFSLAGLISFLLVVFSSQGGQGWQIGSPFWLAAIAVLWGCACLATIVTEFLGFVALMRLRPTPKATKPPSDSRSSALGREPGVLTELAANNDPSSQFTLPRES